jgi:FkbM family methyltransferase
MNFYFRRRRNLNQYLTTSSFLKVVFSRTNSWTKLQMNNSVLSPVNLNSWDVPTFIEVFADGEYNRLTEVGAVSVNTIVDCGANIGLFAIWCSFHFPDAHVTCHEPVGRNLNLGKLNTSRLSSVIWKSSAVSNRSGMVSFTDEGPGSTILWDGYSRDIQANVSLIDLIEEYKDCDIDILKMDIEGSELAILGDDRFPMWSQRLKCIALEWHNLGLIDGNCAFQWYVDRLEECGFTVSKGNTHGEWSGLMFGTRK